jgi:hypothetical protein
VVLWAVGGARAGRVTSDSARRKTRRIIVLLCAVCNRDGGRSHGTPTSTGRAEGRAHTIPIAVVLHRLLISPFNQRPTHRTPYRHETRMSISVCAKAHQAPRERCICSDMYRSRCCARLAELSALSASASSLCGGAYGTGRCGCEAAAVASLLPRPHPLGWAPAAARYSFACATSAHEALKEVMPNGSGERIRYRKPAVGCAGGEGQAPARAGHACPAACKANEGLREQPGVRSPDTIACASPLPPSAPCALWHPASGAPHGSPAVAGVDCTNETVRAVAPSSAWRGRVSSKYEAEAARRGPE